LSQDLFANNRSSVPLLCINVSLHRPSSTSYQACLSIINNASLGCPENVSHGSIRALYFGSRYFSRQPANELSFTTTSSGEGRLGIASTCTSPPEAYPLTTCGADFGSSWPLAVGSWVNRFDTALHFFELGSYWEAEEKNVELGCVDISLARGGALEPPGDLPLFVGVTAEVQPWDNGSSNETDPTTTQNSLVDVGLTGSLCPVPGGRADDTTTTTKGRGGGGPQRRLRYSLM